MIESLMLCGIGLLAGCLLMLLFFPLVHRRAVRLTKRDLAATTPMTINEMQADKDQLRAQFAVSVRKLELRMEEMRAKALSRASGNQAADIARLQVELDKKTALVLALRAREEIRRGVVRRIVKLVLYLFLRSRRRRQQVVFTAPDYSRGASERDASPSELAAAAAAIAAVNLKRRQAAFHRH